MLTEIQVKNAKAQGKAYKLTDGNQMYLYISQTGGKSWRLDAVVNGKRATLTLGKYPAMKLKQAREAADRARELIAKGIDPREEKKRIAEQAREAERQQALTFEKVAWEWFNVQMVNRRPDHIKNIRNRLNHHVLPYIGKLPISEITPNDILEALRHTEARGALDLTRRLYQLVNQIFRYARVCGHVSSNPADGLTLALVPVPKHTPRAALLAPSEVMNLLQSIDAYAGYAPVTFALKIMPYVFVRSMELRGGRWQEIDFDKALWTIPASRMKMKSAHVVPLARQAVELFAELHRWTGDSEFIFPSTHSKNKAITDNGLLLALRRMGYGKDEMSIHGFRSIASTLLNEAGYRWDVIEAALAHAERNAVRAAYNRTTYMEERRAMMQDWADYLDALRAGNCMTMREWVNTRN